LLSDGVVTWPLEVAPSDPRPDKKDQYRLQLFNRALTLHLEKTGRAIPFPSPVVSQLVDHVLLGVLSQSPVNDFFSPDPVVPDVNTILQSPQWHPRGYSGPGFLTLHYARVVRCCHSTAEIMARTVSFGRLVYKSHSASGIGAFFKDLQKGFLGSPLVPVLSSVVWWPNLRCVVPPNVLNIFSPPHMRPSPTRPDRALLEQCLAPLFSHLQDVVCNGNREHADFLLKCLAYPVQLPFVDAFTRTDPPLGYLVVITGPQGSGKTMLFESLLGPILGHENYVYNDTCKGLDSNFNSHVVRRLLVVYDETVLDKVKLDALKARVTEREITAEAKYKSAQTVENYGSIFMLTNHSASAFNCESEDRRMVVFSSGSQLRREPSRLAGLVDFVRDPASPQAFLDYAHYYIPRVTRETIGPKPVTSAMMRTVREQHDPVYQFFRSWCRANLSFITDTWNKVYYDHIMNNAMELAVPTHTFYTHYKAFTNAGTVTMGAANIHKFRPFMEALGPMVRVATVDMATLQAQFAHAYTPAGFARDHCNFVPIQAGERLNRRVTTEGETVGGVAPRQAVPAHECYVFDLDLVRCFARGEAFEQSLQLMRAAAAMAAEAGDV
jgi:energy-coupling factor transporter ATP-binding protein EcfA2